MDSSMEGVVALVTGGASGIGESTVRMIASNGGKVVIADVNSRGNAIASELGKNVLFCQTDITSEESVNKVLKFTKENFEKLNVVVNCAGVFLIGPIYDFVNDKPQSLDNCRKVFEVNTIGTFNVMTRSIGLIKDNEPDEGGQRGVIINIGSVAGFSGNPGVVAYGASKSAIHSMTKSTASHVSSRGIRVVGIAPSITQTPMAQFIRPEDQNESLKNLMFPKRLCQPEEISHLIAFIIQNKFINAEVIRIDAGYRCGNNK